MAKEKKKDEKEIVPVAQETGIAPIVEEAAIQPVEEKEEKAEEPKKDEMPRQTFGDVVRRFILAILRLVIIVAIISGCGAAIYFGVPFLYDNFVNPVEQNASRINDLNLRQSQSEFQISDLQTSLATLEAEQIVQSDAVTGISTRVQSIDPVQTQQAAVMTELDSRVQTLEGANTKRDESLAKLTYQNDLMRAMELLSRARLFLYQSNFGLARSDVQVAHDILAEMQTTAPESKQQDLSEALMRLDLALKNLPDFPVAASDDLDIAWQILMNGYPVSSTGTPTSIPPAALEETATSVPESTVTPTATP